MRAWFLVGLIPLVTACSTMTPSPAKTPPSASLPDTSASDVGGHWTGSWIGTGLFNSSREDSVILDLTQSGDRGYGRLRFDGTIAAESVPIEIRRQGLSGVRVFANISGSRLRVRHELGGQLFTADFTVMGDQMIGHVRGSAPGVRLLLTRGSRPAVAEAAPVVSAAPKPVAPATPVAPVAPAPPPIVSEPPAPEAPREIAAAPAPEAEPQAAERPRQEEFVVDPELKTVRFDFDNATLRPDAQDVLTTNAQWLTEHGDTLVLIEGHCDERGTPEYNLALGERRAKAAMEDLEARGIAADRISTITYGKERPLCTEETEACKSLNRRAEFRVKSR